MANALVVALGAVVGTAISVHVGRTWTGASTLLLAGGFAGVGLVLSLVVNGLLVRWLLVPLERLERAAGRIQEGEEPADVAVEIPPTADPSLARLGRVFNGMMGSLARYREQLREVAGRSLEAGERERLRLSRTLQDDTAQRVASCLLRLRRARDLEGSERDRALDELRDDLGDALESVRRQARALRPPELDDLGLKNALRTLARKVRDRGGPEVRLDLDEVDHLLADDDRLTLYRVVTAALRTYGDTSGSGRPEVVLERRDDAVIALVRDDLEGLPVSPRPGNGSADLELFALRERARLAGGELILDGDAGGRATGVRVRVPVLDRARFGGGEDGDRGERSAEVSGPTGPSDSSATGRKT
jgi:signal transduction histidine kinase